MWDRTANKQSKKNTYRTANSVSFVTNRKQIGMTLIEVFLFLFFCLSIYISVRCENSISKKASKELIEEEFDLLGNNVRLTNMVDKMAP